MDTVELYRLPKAIQHPHDYAVHQNISKQKVGSNQGPVHSQRSCPEQRPKGSAMNAVRTAIMPFSKWTPQLLWANGSVCKWIKNHLKKFMGCTNGTLSAFSALEWLSRKGYSGRARAASIRIKVDRIKYHKPVQYVSLIHESMSTFTGRFKSPQLNV
jgi:hypothetical protein